MVRHQKYDRFPASISNQKLTKGTKGYLFYIKNDKMWILPPFSGILHVAFQKLPVHLCRKKTMKDIIAIQERFARLLLEEAVPSGADYRTICRRLGVHPDDLDEYLLSETGFSGDELLARFVF